MEPNTGTSPDVLDRLMAELEAGWRRDPTLVDALASEHPECAEELYDLYALLVETELGEPAPAEEAARVDANTLAWLQREGFNLAAEVAREERIKRSPTPPASLAADAGGSAPQSGPRSFLKLLVDTTGEPPAEGARRMGVTVQFLSLVAQNAARVPDAWRRELARLAKTLFGIEEEATIGALSGPAAERAALRKCDGPETTMTLDDILNASELDRDQRRFWADLA